MSLGSDNQMTFILSRLTDGVKYELKKRRILPDPHIRIDKSAVIFPSVATVCQFSGWIEIGKRSQINEQCYIHAHEEGIKIGNDVLIGPYTVIHNAKHIAEKSEVKITEQGVVGRRITIEDDVWIGAHCTILGDVFSVVNYSIGTY